MKVYLDDERKTPDGYIRVYTADQAIDCLRSGLVTELSLDHDLGEEKTGYDVVLFLEFMAFEGQWNFIPNIMCVHSANPVGRARMLAGISKIQRMRDGIE